VPLARLEMWMWMERAHSLPLLAIESFGKLKKVLCPYS
jgi:hypothetical protein